MARFKAKIWKTGTGYVVTIPAPLMGAEFNPNQECIVTVEPQQAVKDGFYWILSQDLSFSRVARKIAPATF